VENNLWENLHRLLVPLIRGWTYRAGVPAWKGQEAEVAEDLVQTALLKIIKYLDYAQQHHIPIYSLEHLSRVIAKHCFLDVRRREARLLRFPQDEAEQIPLDALIDPAQEAEEKIYEEGLLIASARMIATFPTKLRRAILVDLANHADFGKIPSVLQQAFLDVGIDLQEYQQPLPTNKAERGNQSALRSLAYKRLAQEMARKESGEIELDAPVIRKDAELAALALHLQRTRHFVATPAHTTTAKSCQK
jgi:DNA-directed RNA polymerase specialized sigma24 family protein